MVTFIQALEIVEELEGGHEYTDGFVVISKVDNFLVLKDKTGASIYICLDKSWKNVKDVKMEAYFNEMAADVTWEDIEQDSARDIGFKKIIDGKLYDTSTAELVWEGRDVMSREVLFFGKKITRRWSVHAQLYKTENDNYFRYIAAGENDQGISWVDTIWPMEEDSVKRFLELQNAVDVYEDLFGEVERA